MHTRQRNLFHSPGGEQFDRFSTQLICEKLIQKDQLLFTALNCSKRLPLSTLKLTKIQKVPC